jgi:hypothetical protein
LYAHICGGATTDELPFYEGVFGMTVEGLYRRGWAGRRCEVEQRFFAAHAETLSPARQRQRLQRAEALARTRSASVGMPHHAALTTPAVPPVTSLPDGGSTAVTTVLVGAR